MQFILIESSLPPQPTEKKGKICFSFLDVDYASYINYAVPVVVFILGVTAGLEVMSCRMLLMMSVISLEVVIVSYGEISISWIGIVYQMGGVVGVEANFMELFVKRKGLKLNPISIMYYVSPCRYFYSYEP